MTWKDYGMSKKEKKIVERFCTNPSAYNLVIIKAAIDSTNKSISKELYPLITIKKAIANYLDNVYIKLEDVNNNVLLKIQLTF